MRTVLTLILAGFVLSVVACGADEEADYETAVVSMEADAASSFAAGSDVDHPAAPPNDRAVTRGAADVDTGPIALPDAAAARKIIYNVELDLAVDQFDGVPGRVAALARQHGGFVASSAVQGSEGEPREGRWTLRIPSARYDAFMAGAESLGQVRRMTSNSREVTAEYADLEARIRNGKAEEQRLHEHLNENTRSLDEILKVEREIARVRGEVERYQGRLNVLKDLTSLSTVTLTIREIDNFAPVPTEEPGFDTQVARTWNGSLDGVGSFLKGVALFGVSATPWLVVIFPAGLVALLVVRRVRRQLAKQPAVV